MVFRFPNLENHASEIMDSCIREEGRQLRNVSVYAGLACTLKIGFCSPGADTRRTKRARTWSEGRQSAVPCDLNVLFTQPNELVLARRQRTSFRGSQRRSYRLPAPSFSADGSGTRLSSFRRREFYKSGTPQFRDSTQALPPSPHSDADRSHRSPPAIGCW